MRGLVALLGLGAMYVGAWAQFAEDRDMTRLHPVWSRGHAAVVAVVLIAVCGATAAALMETPPVAAAIAVLLVLTVGLGLSLDPFIGVAVGCAGAAGAVAVKQALGVWGEEEFAPTVVHVLVLFSAAPLAGLAGRVLRGGWGSGRDAPAAASPEGAAYGSLGLLSPNLGLVRLEEEVERARLFNRPLAVAHVATTVRDSKEVTVEEEEAVLRTVARLVEGHVLSTDVPFAYGAGDVVVILPEATIRSAWEVMSGLVEALTRASFTSPATNERHELSDYAATSVHIASFPEHGGTAEALLNAVRKGAPPGEALLPDAGETAPPGAHG